MLMTDRWSWETVWLTVQVANTLYRVKFIIARRLAVEVIIGTALLNWHVLAIRCTQQRISFRNVNVPIIKQLWAYDRDN